MDEDDVDGHLPSRRKVLFDMSHDIVGTIADEVVSAAIDDDEFGAWE